MGPSTLLPRHSVPFTYTGPSGFSSPRVSPTSPTRPFWVDVMRSRDCTATVNTNPQYRSAPTVNEPISQGEMSI
jgi:hypothetical protein